MKKRSNRNELKKYINESIDEIVEKLKEAECAVVITNHNCFFAGDAENLLTILATFVAELHEDLPRYLIQTAVDTGLDVKIEKNTKSKDISDEEKLEKLMSILSDLRDLTKGE